MTAPALTRRGLARLALALPAACVLAACGRKGPPAPPGPPPGAEEAPADPAGES